MTTHHLKRRALIQSLVVGGTAGIASTARAQDGASGPQDLSFLAPIPYRAGLLVETVLLVVEHEGVLYVPRESTLPFTTSLTFELANWVEVLVTRVFRDPIALKTSGASPRGAGALWRAGAFVYEERASDVDALLTRRDGWPVPLNPLPNAEGFLSFEQLGARGDGVSDDHAAFQLATGRAVRSRPGAVYFIALTGQKAFKRTIRLSSGTHWVFTGGSVIAWDHWGAPLFYCSEADSNVSLVTPTFEWRGYAADELPDYGGEMNSYFGSYALERGAGACHLFLQGCSDVEIVRPRFRSERQTARHAIFSCITIRPRSDKSDGVRLTISDPVFDDFVMGVLGGGIQKIRIIGNIRAGRYDDYYDLPWRGAPGHVIYLTKVGRDTAQMKAVEIGAVFDEGEYLGTSTGAHGFNSVKFRNLKRFTIGSVTSFRPHGCFDGTGLQDGHVGALHWNAPDLGVSNRDHLSNVVFRVTADKAKTIPNKNIYFESLTANYGNLPHVIPIAFAGIGPKMLDERISVGRVLIRTSSTNPSGGITVLKLKAQRAPIIEHMTVDLHGELEHVMFAMGSGTQNARIDFTQAGYAVPVRLTAPGGPAGDDNVIVSRGESSSEPVQQ